MPHTINRRTFLQGAAAAGIALSTPIAARAGGKAQASPAGDLAPTPIWPGGIEKPLMSYTPALKAAGWLFIAGQLASDFETGVAPQAISNGPDAEQLALQTRFVMSNVAKTVAAAGLDFGRDTARLWQWLTSPYPTAEELAKGDNWPRIPTSALFSERAGFLQSPGPISTSMGVKALMVKDTRLEVDLICIDDGSSNEGFESPAPAPGQAAVIRRGDWVFLSSETWQRTAVSGGTEQQADQILSHFAKLAEKAGASLRRTVKAEIHIGHPSEYAGMEAAWKRWFPKNPPARVVMPNMGLTGGKGRRIEIALTLLADNSRKTIDIVHTDKAPPALQPRAPGGQGRQPVVPEPTDGVRFDGQAGSRHEPSSQLPILRPTVAAADGLHAQERGRDLPGRRFIAGKRSEASLLPRRRPELRGSDERMV